MHPHIPQDRRAPESPDWTEPAAPSDRTRFEARTGPGPMATLASVLVLVAILGVIALI